MISFMVERGLVVNLVSVFLLAIGLYAMFSINREALPNVNLDRIQVEVSYPGSTPEEIEKIIIIPIEQELRSLDGIDKMTSISFPGSGRISLELDNEANNRERIVSDVQLAVNRAELPQDLPQDPVVLEIDGSIFPIIQLAISSPRGELELKRLGDKIEDDLLAIDGVAKIQIQGDRRAEIRVVVDPRKLNEHRLSIGEIADVLDKWNINSPGGDIETPEGQKAVRIVGEYQNSRDASSVVLRANERGEALTLADIATVSESLEKAEFYYDAGNTPALNMIIMKKSDADVISMVDAVKKYLKTVPSRYGDDVHINDFQDMSRFARLRLGVLTTNGMVGLLLVFISLLLFLRASVALTTTWGLPIVFFTGLYALFLSGITLNLVSMLGFIMVLGMLVDDAIIIGENITYHMEQGMAPKRAAVTGAVELIGPVTSTVLTTIIAFFPLMFMSGMIGKFIIAIPIVVILLLVFSWLESFLILPNHVAHVTNPNLHPGERGWLVALENIYAKVLETALTYRWSTVGISVLILFGSLLFAAFFMSFQLFPAVGVDQYMARVTAPHGTNLEQMRENMRAIDREIRKHVNLEYVENTILSTGQIAIDGGDPLTQRGGRFGQIRVLYIPAVLRPEHDAITDMTKLSVILPEKFPQLDIALSEVKPGPPTGRALEVEISSNNNEVNEVVAARLINFLKQVEGVTTVESGLQRGDDELHVVFDRKLAAFAGIDLSTAASHVRAAVGGLRVTTTRRGTEEVDVTIRYPENETGQVAQLMALHVPNQRGGLVPLNKIARLDTRKGYTTIRHKSGVRVISVLANIDLKRLTSLEINKLVSTNQSEWLGDAAAIVNINYGGENEKNTESFVDLFKSFGFALVGIFFILAIQFNRLSYPFLVMLAIPFGIVGVIISFYLHSIFWKPMPLSFFSTMGMVALTGVVVNSSLILLVFIQRAIKEGMNYNDAILLAGRRRLRAVILTATTTVVGLLPTAYGWGGMDPFVAPMALALSWGLAFATLVTLITIPAALAVSLDTKEHLVKWFGPSMCKFKLKISSLVYRRSGS